MFEIFNNTNNDINTSELEDYIKYVVKELDIENAIFNIIFIDNEEIREINREYRNVDRETDVISFALEDNMDVVYEDFRLLGDIYISYEKAIEQAELYNHSVKREVFFLATHGILHLLGYDHMEEDDEKVMFGKQNELLDGYGITRESK
mgnify:FL=1